MSGLYPAHPGFVYMDNKITVLLFSWVVTSCVMNPICSCYVRLLTLETKPQRKQNCNLNILFVILLPVHTTSQLGRGHTVLTSRELM